jgi:uncharacterized membrane protein
MAWAFQQVFSGRGALIHIGALMATIVSGNLFMNIIPNQKKVVTDLLAGREPNSASGLDRNPLSGCLEVGYDASDFDCATDKGRLRALR